jgi:hypothetical protein
MLNGKKLVLIGLMVLGTAAWGFSPEAKDSSAGEKEKEKKSREYYRVEKAEEVAVTATMTPKSISAGLYRMPGRNIQVGIRIKR